VARIGLSGRIAHGEKVHPVFETIVLSFAFVFGLAVRQIGLPPLVGFLAAGFAINLVSAPLGLPQETGPILDHVAHLGVLLLLFTVGLKLKLRQVAQPQVIGGALLHFAISVAVFTPAAKLLMAVDWETALLLGIALAFSSTVLAAKLLEGKRELGAFHARTAIGLLIVQDIIALGVLAIWSGQAPNGWAVLVLALPVLRPVLHKVLDLAGHDEILVLMGMLLALVIGGYGFEAMGLSSEIGALAMGVLLSNHPRAGELSRALWSLKEVFLVAFFLQIGLTGLPDGPALVFALVVGLALPLKGMLFYALLIAFKLRARSAFLSALSLTAYSEFGLIVAASVLPDYLVPLALAVTLSFVLAAPLNRAAHPLYEWLEHRLQRYERATFHPDEQPKDLGRANVLVFGMGRTGSAAYDQLVSAGMSPVGLDADIYRVEGHQARTRHVLFADAEDSNFWRSVDLGHIQAAVLALGDLEAKIIAVRSLRARGFVGPIIAHVMHEETRDQLREAGADYTYLTMTQAGVNLADRTISVLSAERS
jgi:predicted Kef-type K+ transport protein